MANASDPEGDDQDEYYPGAQGESKYVAPYALRVDLREGGCHRVARVSPCFQVMLVILSCL